MNGAGGAGQGLATVHLEAIKQNCIYVPQCENKYRTNKALKTA